jgi:hypothetical protein
MSTPTATLPVSNSSKTTENNDINDPIVQDVLKDFRETAQPNPKESNMIPDYEEDTAEFATMDPPYPIHHRPRQQYNVYDNYPVETNKEKSILNIDMDLVKKNLTIIILVLLVHNTGTMNMFYEKLPENMVDIAIANDILVKAFALFIILYLLMFFNYI